MKKTIADDFEFFWNKILNKENFTYIRYADGEKGVILNKPFTTQEEWVSKDYETVLSRDLLASLSRTDDKIWYGVSCPCCDVTAHYWYLNHLKTKNISFSNLWINNNFKSFKEKIQNLERDTIFIGNYRAGNVQIGKLNILKHYHIGDDCFSFWENECPKLIEQIIKDFGGRNDLLYIVSAGPMAGLIILKLFDNNPNNTYIDFGSSVDCFYRKDITRPFMIEGNVYATRNCFMETDEDEPHISVVLNCYKRPENLPLQIKAILNQSIKPKEILLFQDGTADGLTVEIPEEIKPYLTKFEKSPENIGVWGRFAFARKYASCPYVCVFDDDTIPGENWLANCYVNMREQEGLYGTIGIVAVNRKKKYPSGVNRNYVRVGWDGPLNQRIEVDFAGHSWFFKREWLEYLFETPKEIQDLKYVGEDMSFSFMLQKHGIKTFVPPHPKDDFTLYGSNPELAIKLGTAKTGVSLNANNLALMQKAYDRLLDLGFKRIIDNNATQARSIEYALKRKKQYVHPVSNVKYIVNKLLRKIK